jgi:type I restriction enzyme S subunit
LSGKKRLPGFEGEWEEFIFSDITERINRKNVEADDTVVTISAQRGFILQEDYFNKRVASDTLINYTLVHNGEYCYNKSYSKGYPMGAFKRLDDFEKAVVTTLYICFSLKENVDSDFLNQYFGAGKMIPGLMRIAQEGGRAHGLLNISLPDFFRLPVTIPMLEEQTAIAQVLNTADQEIELLTSQRNQLQLQKKGLMQQLLTGKKRLKI